MTAPLSRTVEAHRLQLGENCADKNLCFDAKQNSVSIIRDPDRGATELPVRLQFKIFANLVKLQIDFYRVVTASMHRDFFSANYRDGSKICASGGIDDDAINAAIPEWLTTQIKQCRVQIEQIGKTKLAGLCCGRAAFAFRPRASYAVISKSEVGGEFF